MVPAIFGDVPHGVLCRAGSGLRELRRELAATVTTSEATRELMKGLLSHALVLRSRAGKSSQRHGVRHPGVPGFESSVSIQSEGGPVAG